MSDDKKVAAAEKNLERVIAWHPRIDTRITWTLGIYTAMLGYLFSILSELKAWPVWALVPGLVTIVMILRALRHLYKALRPDTLAPAGSLLFFGEICSRDHSVFASDWRSMTESSYLADLSEQTHRNAEIVSHKFSRLKAAMRIMIFAVIFWALTIALLQPYKSSAKQQSSDLRLADRCAVSSGATRDQNDDLGR